MLTVADVRGTNPKLWNSWKAKLFHDLYALTQRALRRGLENPIDREQLILETKENAREALRAKGLDEARIDAVWELFDDNYFLRHHSDEIVWHTDWLAHADTSSDTSLVAVRQQENGDRIEAVLYTPVASGTRSRMRPPSSTNSA